MAEEYNLEIQPRQDEEKKRHRESEGQPVYVRNAGRRLSESGIETETIGYTLISILNLKNGNKNRKQKEIAMSFAVIFYFARNHLRVDTTLINYLQVRNNLQNNLFTRTIFASHNQL